MSDHGYAFANQWELAERRLRALEESRDPVTIRRLRALGVGPGWRCLELGAGRGSIASWMCQQVGPDGTVTALDMMTASFATWTSPTSTSCAPTSSPTPCRQARSTSSTPVCC
jgi:2-polyprenyl-3-methyl-5-hydroxy-6-metoxy-1,4-benzoquinol methylase